MNPTTTAEFRRLALVFGATCTKGSMMLAVARTIQDLHDDEPLPPFAATLPAIKPLVAAVRKTDGVLTSEVLCEYFASPKHFGQIKRDGTIVGSEIEMDPEDLRPVLHTLLPLDNDGLYRNGGVAIELLNLVEFDRSEGEGFWAAHLAGKIWIPLGSEYRARLLKMQAASPVFVQALHTVANQHGVVDYYEYRRLVRQTNEAKEEITDKSR